jgi:hypothetical protein
MASYVLIHGGGDSVALSRPEELADRLEAYRAKL